MNYCNIIPFILFIFPEEKTGTIDYVSLKEIPEVWIKAGQLNSITLNFEIKEGYHIMSDNPGNEYFIPTKLSLTDNEKIHFGEFVFPMPEKFRIEGNDKEFNVLQNQFSIKVPLLDVPSNAMGLNIIEGSLYYQACDSKKCFFPKELPITIKIHVE